jgi:hypothetical protein
MDTVTRVNTGETQATEPVAGEIKYLQVRVPVDLWERLQMERMRRRSSVQQICFDAIIQYLAKDDASDAA